MPYDSASVVGTQDSSELAALERVPLFSGLDRRDLAAVERISRAVEFPAGEILIHENEPGHHFFVVLNGQASVERDGAEINRLEPGGLLRGDLAALEPADDRFGRDLDAGARPDDLPCRVQAAARGPAADADEGDRGARRAAAGRLLLAGLTAAAQPFSRNTFTVETLPAAFQ